MSRELKETTSQKNFPARISVRMRVRIFSPVCRRMVTFRPGYFPSKRFRRGAASGVFIAVYHTSSRSLLAASTEGVVCAKAGPAATESAARSRADLEIFLDMTCLEIGRAHV